MLERRIVLGLITSTEFARQIRVKWDPQYIESTTAKRLASWVIEYFDKYNKAPGRDIEGIFLDKAKTLPPDTVDDIEEILSSLSDEDIESPTNVDYLVNQASQYFTERRLTLHSDNIKGLIAEGSLIEAEKEACEYKPLVTGSTTDLDMSTPESLTRIDKAFCSEGQVIIKYPKQLGTFWNSQMIRGAFVALMASEKRGKTFWLLDMAMRACKQKRNVAFFQAGDMTEAQQLKRMCVYLAQKSDQARYCGLMYEPVRDCIYNQIDNCTRKDRTCSFGVFEGHTEDDIRKGSTIVITELVERYKEYPDYVPCQNCVEYDNKPWGAVWIKEVNIEHPLTVDEAKTVSEEFFINHSRRFKLSSHANGTLSVKQIKAILDIWERQDNFVPDCVIVDYADLLVPEIKSEFRHQQNDIWKGLRNLSQERFCLVVTATQADAKSYTRNRLSVCNFSEDKRKYAHVTAMYGLNQDTQDREKKIGLMRINEIVIREGEFSNLNEVTVLQNLKRGRPFIGSFW